MSNYKFKCESMINGHIETTIQLVFLYYSENI
jgi:hypothetical protein